MDGKPKFDLMRFNEDYFSRLRPASPQLPKGAFMSLSCYLMAGASAKAKGHNPWPGHPFHRDNNINGIDGDLNGDGQGPETHAFGNPEVLALQEAYVRKVMDTVGDLDNILYEISNESFRTSLMWQYYLIDFIKKYESEKPKQHPVGMTAIWPEGKNEELFASRADWVSPKGDLDNPVVATGSKVVISDTDHICGVCGDSKWVWEELYPGVNPIFMDPYDKSFMGRGAPEDYDSNNKNDSEIRQSMGNTASFSRRAGFEALEPCTSHAQGIGGWRGLLNRFRWSIGLPETGIASSGYCLSNVAATGTEYIVYLPDGGEVMVDLRKTAGSLNAEWVNADTGTTTIDSQVVGGTVRNFSSPYGNTHAVLYLISNNRKM